MKEYKCLNCGRVHVALPPAMQADLSEPDRIKLVKCFSCGASAERFVLAKPEDAPRGCTLQPIIIARAYDT